MSTKLEKGAFVCSIDTELAWGYAHLHTDPTEYEHWASYGRVRESVERLIALMDEYEIRATWAVVGRLMVDPRDASAVSAYPENPQPAKEFLTENRFADRDFLDRWYAPELLEKIRNAKSSHEIGSHTFSHLIEGEDGYSEDLIEQDLAAANKHANQLGIQLKSLIFPKNRVAYTDTVARQGFTSYRSVPANRGANLPSFPRRVVQKLDAYLPVPPTVTYPRWDGNMWELPASYYHRHVGGWARWQSTYVRSAKLKAGVKQAASKNALFHVWFHPYDIASDPDRLLRPLEKAFAEVRRLRDKGEIENVTMGELSEQLAQKQPVSGTTEPAVRS